MKKKLNSKHIIAGTAIIGVSFVFMAMGGKGPSEVPKTEAVYVVTLKDGRASEELTDLESPDLELTSIRSITARKNRLTIRTPDPVHTLSTLRNHPIIETAGFEARVTVTPNDSLYNQQWALPKISAPSAWDLNKGSTSVVIAVLDTGFAMSHQDLSSKWVSSANRFDFVHNDNDPSVGQDCLANPPIGSCTPYGTHGTLTAGIAAAITNNSTGIAGVNWNSKIMPVQVLADSGSGSTADVADGIEWAVDHGADVISMSLGSSGNDPTLAQAVQYAFDNGVVMAAASGNSGTRSVLFPAAYFQVIAVGASNQSDDVASFSSYGPELDIVAPGVSTLTTYWTTSNQTSGYAFASGTSLATPHVSGVASLILSVSPSLSPTIVRQAIIDTADKPAGMGGAVFTERYGYGRVNAYHAVRGNYSWSHVSTSYSTGTPIMSPGQTQTITVVAKNTGTTTWERSGTLPIKLGTWLPGRTSKFQHGSWPDPVRPALLSENTVSPGNNGTFVFTVQAPNEFNQFGERMSLVVEGLTWFNDPGFQVYFNVVNGYQWQLVDVNHSTSTALMDPGDTQTITIRARNTGTATWQKSGSTPVRLGTWPPQRLSALYHSSWLFPTRPGVLTESTVAPGDIGTFNFTVRAGSPGEFTERVNLVTENVAWFNDVGAQYYIRVKSGFVWQLVDINHSTGTAAMSRGDTVTLTLRARNVGDITWKQGGEFPVRLGTIRPHNRGSVYFRPSWIRDFRPVGLTESSVPPGGIATFTFEAQVPGTPGEYFEYFSLVAENFTWFNDPGVFIYIKSL